MTSPDLSQSQIEKAEDHIAYEGQVELLHWQDTSGHGFKIQLGLSDRGQLDYFDGVMSMRKSRGGQRYHVITPERQFEAQFCGRGWAETKGAHIALHIGELDTIQWLRMQTAKDQLEKEESGELWHLIMMELDDDHTIINQARRALVHGVVDPVPKGGPRSKNVAMLLQDRDFAMWFDHRSIYNPGRRDLTFDERDRRVKQILDIDSKVQLDCDDNADELWHLFTVNIHRPFLAYMQRASIKA